MNQSDSKKSISKDVLIKTTNQLQAIFQSVPDGITVEDKNGVVVYANDAAARTFGFEKAHELTHKKITKLFGQFQLTDRRGNEIPLDRLPAIRALKSHQDVVKVMKLTHKKTDEEKWLIVKASLAHVEKGDPKLVVKLLQDITDEVEEQKRRELFVSLVSHEIKNPLTSIKAFAQLLKRRIEKQNTDQAVEFVSNIDDQVDKVIKIINDLLDISKIRRGILKLDLKRVDLDYVVEKTIQSFKPTAPEYTIIQTGKVDTFVRADEIRIGQVLLNLLTNARKYSSGGKIVVNVKKTKDTVVIAVTDQGVGIPKQRLRDIFRLYSRVESDKLKAKPGGLGLGLYISTAIVKSHKGKIWVKSKEGKGSTFFFSLPLK